jgi:predicted dehydrogenase
MRPSLSRRQLARGIAAAAASLACPAVSMGTVLGANARLNIAAIGAGGMGIDDTGYCKGENIVALCDVDEHRAAPTFKAFPHAKRFKDFRVMLDKEARHIDAVTISTPVHTHFHPAQMTIDLGKHVYLQKPLTHSVWEARTLTALAREKKVVTQMGNQGHAHPDSRRLAELIRAGVLGDVREIHVWTHHPVWPQGMARPPAIPVPSTLDWNLWVGPAPWRAFHSGCVPIKWRAFWDFGSGALGDMGCHNMDLAFMGLDLRDPVAIEGTSSGVSEETAPRWCIVTYDFPEANGRPAVKLTWYDGGKKPPASLAKQPQLSDDGCLLVGTKDTLYVPYYWGPGRFVSGAKMADFASVPLTLPRFGNGEDDQDVAHHQEWIAACKGEGKTFSGFDYAGPMTEAVLLGNVALRMGKRIAWDAANLRVTNAPEAARFIRRDYRAF